MTLPKLEWNSTSGEEYSHTDTSSFTVPDQAKREVHCCHNKLIHQEARARAAARIASSSNDASSNRGSGTWLSTKNKSISKDNDS